MIRHCAMFKWNEGVGDDVISAVGRALDELATMDVIHSYAHGSDLGFRDTNWDYVVVGDFATEADYLAYSSDQGHLDMIAEFIVPNVSDRAGIQYSLAVRE